MKLVMQQNEQDCLLACYSMILRNLKVDVSPGDLRQWRPLPADGLSAGYLRSLNELYGLSMSVRRPSRDAETEDALRRLGGPVIAHWQNRHFVVIEHFGRQRVSVLDPAIGRVKLRYQTFWEFFSGAMILLSPNDSFTTSTGRGWSNGVSVAQFLSGRAVAALAASVLFAQLVTIGVAAGTRHMLNSGLPSASQVVPGVAVALLSIVAAFVLRSGGLRWGADCFETRYTQQLFRGLLAQRLSYFASQSVGGIMEKLSLRYVMKDSLITVILPSVLSLLSVVLTLAYLLRVSIPLTLVLVAGATTYFAVSCFLTRRQMEANQTYVQTQLVMSGDMQSTLQNVDAVKATGTEEGSLARWSLLNADINREYGQVIKWRSLASAAQMSYASLMLVLVVWVGLVLARAGTLRLVDILLFQTGMALFSGAVAEAQGLVLQVSNVLVYRDKQSDLLHTSPSVGVIEQASQPGEIVARSLAFGYPGHPPMCLGVNVQVEPGQKVALMGPSGTGKSSLLYVLLGLNDFSGELRVGSADFREQTGVLFPNMTLVEGTVRENLIMDNPREVSDVELYEVLEDVNLIEKVEALPAFLDSRVLASGRNFSTGQAQRLLLARALVRGRQFLFLDEALSSLDEENRDHIYRSLLSSPRYRGVTVVMISHDPGVAEHCDVVWLMNGRDSFQVIPVERGATRIRARGGRHVARVAPHPNPGFDSSAPCPTELSEPAGLRSVGS